MHSRLMTAVAAIIALAAAGAAVASHVTQMDQATVPTGFLAAHSSIEGVDASTLERALTPRGADVLIQHVRLGPKAPTGWHTHPGPAIVTVVSGSLTYEAASLRRDVDNVVGTCASVTYTAGKGFVDRGFGHVHRAIAGAGGVDFYVVYLLPPGTETHVIPASAPQECGP